MGNVREGLDDLTGRVQSIQQNQDPIERCQQLIYSPSLRSLGAYNRVMSTACIWSSVCHDVLLVVLSRDTLWDNWHALIWFVSGAAFLDMCLTSGNTVFILS